MEDWVEVWQFQVHQSNQSIRRHWQRLSIVSFEEIFISFSKTLSAVRILILLMLRGVRDVMTIVAGFMDSTEKDPGLCKSALIADIIHYLITSHKL